MKLPRNIRSICETPTALLSEYNDSGIKVIGYTCSYVPEELILSAGLQPYRIPNIGANVSSLTPSFICPFASAILENILRLRDFFHGIVIAHTCDPMWRLYDILKKKIDVPLFFLRVPHDTQNELSISFLEMEFVRFKKFLEEKFRVKISGKALSNSIRLCNESRSLLKNIYLLNSDSKYKIDASIRFQLVLAGMWMPKLDFNEQVKALEFNSDEKHGNVRLHVNGTAIYDLNLISIMEEAGGFVASDDLCTGSRYFWSNVEKGSSLMSALAHRYASRTPCPSHGPLNHRLDYIKLMVRKFNVQGVVTLSGRFCDPILYDSVHIRNMLTEMDIPVAVIDYERPSQEINRIKTRIEAFIESIGD
jgi:benzoyl-CoA reductase subunit C